jgi:hypothetical protein
MPKTLLYLTVVITYVLLLTFIVWLVGIRPRRPLRDRIAGLLQIVAAYAFTLGVLKAGGILEAFPDLSRGLTSNDLAVFLGSNFHAFGILFTALWVALSPTTTSSAAAFLLRLPVLIGLSVILVAYGVLHFLVVVPVAYVGYLITSVPIDAILHSARDATIENGKYLLEIKRTVVTHEVELRNFAVAVPAFVLGVVLKMLPLLKPGSTEGTKRSRVSV